MTSGRDRFPGEAWEDKLQGTVKLEKDNLVLRHTATGLALGNAGAVPYGIAVHSTLNLPKYTATREKSYDTGGVTTLVSLGQLRLNLPSDNAAIVKGDTIVAIANGHVDLENLPAILGVGAILSEVITFCNAVRKNIIHKVGTALEDVDANSGGEILVDVDIGGT